jgi:hypothetical protein
MKHGIPSEIVGERVMPVLPLRPKHKRKRAKRRRRVAGALTATPAAAWAPATVPLVGSMSDDDPPRSSGALRSPASAQTIA